MSPLKTSVAAGAAFILGWAAHEALARLPGRQDSTAPTSVQAEQAKKSEEERLAREKTSDGVLVPLNARDPSALVMGAPELEAGPGACVQRPPKPCDCTEENLRRTGRDAPERF
jgi:hypothetical protein